MRNMSSSSSPTRRNAFERSDAGAHSQSIAQLYRRCPRCLRGRENTRGVSGRSRPPLSGDSIPNCRRAGANPPPYQVLCQPGSSTGSASRACARRRGDDCLCAIRGMTRALWATFVDAPRRETLYSEGLHRSWCRTPFRRVLRFATLFAALRAGNCLPRWGSRRLEALGQGGTGRFRRCWEASSISAPERPTRF